GSLRALCSFRFKGILRQHYAMNPFPHLPIMGRKEDHAMAAVLEPRSYRLQDNLVAEGERVFLTGTQALVRLLLSQRRRDRERGLTTAGFVSGYRGSPLGVVDLA